MIDSPLLGLLLLGLLAAAPLALRRFKASTPDGVRVLGRTALHKGAVVAVVAVGERRLLVGAGERGVQLLTELDATGTGDGRAPGADGLDPTATTTTSTTANTSPFIDLGARTDAAAGVGSTPEPAGDALEALLAGPDAAASAAGASSSHAGPGTGLVDRLRAMTVRTAPQRPHLDPGMLPGLGRVGGGGRPSRVTRRR